MQAVILAAGKSSRFYPFSAFAHKSMVTLMGEPILKHTLRSIKKAGIKSIIIVISPDSTIPQIIGDGSDIDVSITYCEQKEAQGMGDALLCAKDHINSDFFLLNAHRVDFSEYKDKMMAKRTLGSDVVLLARQEENVSKFGVIKVNGDRVREVLEKPQEAQSSSGLRILGIYLLTKSFLNTLMSTPPSHYHFESALSEHAQKEDMRVVITANESFTYKYPWDIFPLKKYILDKQRAFISEKATVTQNTIIHGEVIIDEGAKILEGVCIKGPVYIGKNVIVGNNALIRDYSIIEEGAVIGANSEVKNSLIGPKTTAHSALIEDSIIGLQCKLGAFFCSSNVRLDRQNISVLLDDKQVNTHLRDLGVIMGNHVRTGVHVTTMPGVIIGNNSIIGPSTTVMKNISEYTKVYTTFLEVREEIQK